MPATRPITLTDAIRDYLRAMALGGRSPCTIRNARATLRELADFMARLCVFDIATMGHDPLLRYREWIAQRPARRGSPLQVASQCEYLSSVRAFCDWLVEQDQLPTNPMRRIPQPRRHRRLPRSILEPEEVALLCELPDLGSAVGLRDRGGPRKRSAPVAIAVR